MKKHKYQIIIGNPSKKSNIYCYDYSANKGRNIILNISEKGIKITAELSKLYHSEKIINSSNYIFADAIKKSLLLYLILYSKNIVIKNMKVQIDEIFEEISVPMKGHFPPIYSLVVGKLHTSFLKEWNNSQFIQALLSKTPSNYAEDSRWAALFATICAKSKQYEAERFLYFWMAFNGIYDYLFKQIKKPKAKKQSSEKKQLTLFLKLYDLGYQHIERNDAGIIAHEVMSVITRHDLSAIISIDDIPKCLEKQIKKILSTIASNKYNIKPKGYLLVSFPYYFRCKYFHAGRTLPLFCYANEQELKCLHLINTLLEEFIDKNLYHLFENNYVDNTFKEKIKLIANNEL